MASDTSEAGDKKLQNQFSFVERATQTMNNALKVSAFLTEKFSIKSKTRKINDKNSNCTFYCNFYLHVFIGWWDGMYLFYM